MVAALLAFVAHACIDQSDRNRPELRADERIIRRVSPDDPSVLRREAAIRGRLASRTSKGALDETFIGRIGAGSGRGVRVASDSRRIRYGFGAHESPFGVPLK
jgi:hypothetical protein